MSSTVSQGAAGCAGEAEKKRAGSEKLQRDGKAK